MNSHMFREYDIRGIAGTDLDDVCVEELGRAFGTYYRRKDLRRIVVARDMRVTSVAYEAALIRGLISTGCQVIDIGLAPTPVMYFAVETMDLDGGIMVTASHNPPEFNGFKSRTRERAIFGPDIQTLFDLTEKRDYVVGTGSVEPHELLPTYLDHLAENIHLKRPLHIVMDCGNGVGGIVAPQLFERLGCKIEGLYLDPDGTFPNHIADPTVPKYMQDLSDKVRETGADIGIGFDGDVDRVGIVDEKGRLLFGDELLIYYARSILPQQKSAVVFDVKCSQALVDEIERLGGKPEMWRTGYPHIQSHMTQTGAHLAGEMSGHMYFGDRYFGYDDGIYAACRAVEILSHSTTTLSESLEDVPKYVSTPEIRVEATDEGKFDVVTSVADHFRERYKTIEVDGVRILFPNGWGLVRASNTQAALVVRCEADTSEHLEEIKDLVRAKLQEFESVTVEF